MKWVCQADNLFVCFRMKSNKGLSLRSRRDWKWAREDQSGELEKGTQRRQSTPDSRRDQSAWDGVQEQWGKTSQDESAFLMALWKFREGCTSALVYGFTGNAVSRNHPSCTWVNPSLYCSFVLCSFSPTPSVVFLVAIKKCEIHRWKPLDGSPAKTELFKEVDKY